MSAPVPPGPLVPAAWITLGFAVAFAVVLLLTGCGSTQLPADKCTDAHKGAYRRACVNAVQFECESGRLCPDVAICDEAIAKVCK
jgi:uncharacterized protein YceK